MRDGVGTQYIEQLGIDGVGREDQFKHSLKKK